MAITIPSNPAKISTSKTGSQAIIKAATWEDAAEAQHHSFAYTGARIPGRYHDDPITTTSTSFTQDNLTGDDLDSWFPTSQILRQVAGDAAIIELKLFGSSVTARLSLVDLSTGTTIATLEVSQAGGTTASASGTESLTWAETFIGDSAVNDKENFAYKLEFKSSAGTASLVAWGVHEAHISASDLP